MNKQAAFRWCRGSLLGLLVSMPLWADDTDIYLNNGAQSAGVARVMLALDFRSNVGSTICNDADSDSCRAIMGDTLYPEMDLYGVDGERGADGYPDRQQTVANDPNSTVAASYWSGTKTNLYDVLRSVVRAVIEEVGAKVANNASDPNDPGYAGVEVGVMVAHEGDCKGAGPSQLPNLNSGKDSGCSQGAYILKGFTDISDPQNREDLYVKIAAVPEPGVQASWMKNSWNGHSYKIRDLYLELYRYVTGKEVYNGFLGYNDYNSQEDRGNLYETDNDVVFDLDADPNTPVLALLAPDTTIMTGYDLGNSTIADTTDDLGGASYVSPLDPNDACSSLYVINSLFGSTGNSHSDTDSAISSSTGSGGLGLPLSGGQDDKDVQLVGHLFDVDLGDPAYGLDDIPGEQNITSYVISDQVRKNTNAIAAAGGTGQAYPLGDPESALETLSSIFNDILSVSTTFVAASVPTNVFNRAEVVDNIYFALFQAEPEVRWNGNIKKLKIVDVEVPPDPNDPDGVATTEKLIVDVDGYNSNAPTSAISPEDGRILRDALTFWTNENGADVQAFDPNSPNYEVQGKDGRSITRGGAGQKVPGYLQDSIDSVGRSVYTEDPEAPDTLLQLTGAMADTSTIRPYLDPNDVLGADTTREQELVDWIRGTDVYDEDGDGDVDDARPWLMMDAMHSRPLVVNYGAREGTSYTQDNPDIRLFFGTNDGLFHILKNTTSSGTGSESGEEVFAFVPLELLHWQKTLADNFAQTDVPHPYGMDGEAVTYVLDRDRDGNIEATGGDKVWVFIGQRRGGNNLYAFDVTDPDNPEMMWKINNTVSGFEQLAMTFSTPQVSIFDLDGTVGGTPALVFAGGYNGGWSGGARVGKDAGDANDTIGNAIYVVDAETGSLIWKAVGPDGGTAPSNSDTLFYQSGMLDSIPSEVTVVDTDSNDMADRAYVGDTGGNVWRIELTEFAYKQGGGAVTDENNWYVTKLAGLGGSGADDRRFFHAPDFVRTSDDGGDYDAVILTSGDRAHPLGSTVDNYAFMIKDRLVGTNSSGDIKTRTPLGIGDLVDITDLCVTGSEANCTSANLTNGWKLSLETSGEKGLSQPLTTNGVILFTTYLPNDGAASLQCAPSEGTSNVYIVNLGNGSVVFDLETSGTITKEDRHTSTGAGIAGDVIPFEDDVLVPGKGVKGQQIKKIPGRTMWRVYWREEEIDQL